jgi:hypothetical protein
MQTASIVFSVSRDGTLTKTQRIAACTINMAQVTAKCDTLRVTVGPSRRSARKFLAILHEFDYETAQLFAHLGNLTISSRFFCLFSNPCAYVKVHQTRFNIDWIAGTSDTTTCGLTEAQPPHVDRCHASPWAA